jgi:hypothetical protein
MIFSYDPVMSQPKDEVRFLLGDTDDGDPQLWDEEIEKLLTDESTVLRAAARGAERLAFKYARQVSMRVGAVSQNLSDIAPRYEALAKQLRRQASSSSVMVYAGGISVSERDSARLNADRIQSPFEIEMETEPGTTRIEHDITPVS